MAAQVPGTVICGLPCSPLSLGDRSGGECPAVLPRGRPGRRGGTQPHPHIDRSEQRTWRGQTGHPSLRYTWSPTVWPPRALAARIDGRCWLAFHGNAQEDLHGQTEQHRGRTQRLLEKRGASPCRAAPLRLVCQQGRHGDGGCRRPPSACLPLAPPPPQRPPGSALPLRSQVSQASTTASAQRATAEVQQQFTELTLSPAQREGKEPVFEGRITGGCVVDGRSLGLNASIGKCVCGVGGVGGWGGGGDLHAVVHANRTMAASKRCGMHTRPPARLPRRRCRCRCRGRWRQRGPRHHHHRRQRQQQAGHPLPHGAGGRQRLLWRGLPGQVPRDQ